MESLWGTEYFVACADVVVIVSYVDYVLCPHMLFSHLNGLCLTYAFFFYLIDEFHSLSTDFDRVNHRPRTFIITRLSRHAKTYRKHTHQRWQTASAFHPLPHAWGPTLINPPQGASGSRAAVSWIRAHPSSRIGIVV
jgi:hypothetical protein